MKIIIIIGTRPEAIKMAPVAVLARERGMNAITLSTGQHKEMLGQTCEAIGMKIDADLGIMAAGNTLSDVAGEALKRVDKVIRDEKPDWVLVQGDTGTAFAGGLAAFYNKVKVGHVEAGLRSFDNYNPYPEEVNRKLIGAFADLHFAPTEDAAANLRREAVEDERVLVTGNTVIDALREVRGRIAADASLTEKIAAELPPLPDGKKLILVTSHRRENHGEALENICGAVRELAEKRPDLHFLYPVHLNPNVRDTVHRLLDGVPNIALTTPVSYLSMAYLMDRSHFILTDSGGIQEEATAFSTPVLVLRETTERGEGVKAGVAKLIGAEKSRIISESLRLLDDKDAFAAMSREAAPYGDGHASGRILDALAAA